MARPKQDGLLYFSFDTDFFYADKRIKRLHSKYGNDGLMLYIYLLTEIYRNGYYTRWDKEIAEDTSADLHLTEGLIEQVMAFLVSRSLLTKSTLANSDTIITSPGIQKRYQEAKKGCKRQIEVNPEIWILSEEETASCIKVTHNVSNSEKNKGNSGKNHDNSEKNYIKESKVNNLYDTAFQPGELEDAFQMYLTVRKYNYGDISAEQVQALRDELKGMSSEWKEQMAIVKKATSGGWKTFYKLKKEKSSKETKAPVKQTGFNNFKGREYDMSNLERQLVERGAMGVPKQTKDGGNEKL